MSAASSGKAREEARGWLAAADEDVASARVHQAELATWAGTFAETFEGRASLLAAEIAMREGRTWEAAQLFERAVAFRKEHTREITDLGEFKAFFTPKNEENPEIHGGFAHCYFTEAPEAQELLAKLKVTVRCVPLDSNGAFGKCIFTGQPTNVRGVFAKAY